MAWKRFNQKTAITMLPPRTCELSIGMTASAFTFSNWIDVGGCSHIIYLIDEESKSVGIQFLNELDADGDDLAVAYKITRNGYHRFSFTGTKFIKSLPFKLVDAKQTRHGTLETGKWQLDFVWHQDEMIAEIKSEAGDA